MRTTYATVIPECDRWGRKQIDASNAAEVASWWCVGDDAIEEFGKVGTPGFDRLRFVGAVRKELCKLSCDFPKDVAQIRVLMGLLSWVQKEEVR